MTKTSFMTLTIISLLTFGCKAQQESASKPISTSAPERIAKLFQGNDVIWGFDFLDEKKIIFTERSGPINILDMTTGKTQSIKNLPKVEQHGQGGMLDVSLHPEFKNNNWVYLSYSVKESDGVETRISRAKLIDNSFQDLQILFTSNSKSNKGEHFGSRIVFDGQGHIFFSVGDRGNRDDAQKTHIRQWENSSPQG
jgi:glucose/arabinose dehydrogenase